jgi:hypothetical protein
VVPQTTTKNLFSSFVQPHLWFYSGLIIEIYTLMYIKQVV